MRFRIRYPLRYVLVLLTVVAIVLAIWRTRPTAVLTIELAPHGIAKVGGSEHGLSRMRDVLDKEHAWRRLWRMDSDTIHLVADPAASHPDIVTLVSLGTAAGFQNVVFVGAHERNSVIKSSTP